MKLQTLRHNYSDAQVTKSAVCALNSQIESLNTGIYTTYTTYRAEELGENEEVLGKQWKGTRTVCCDSATTMAHV